MSDNQITMLLDSPRPFYTISAAVVFGLVLIIGYVKYQEMAAAGSITIITGTGPVEISVERADTPEKMELGLKNRRSLGKNSGMFFVFSDVKSKIFTMRDVLIPLDLIFISPSGIVNEVVTLGPCRNYSEETCPPYASKNLTSFVVEVNAGFASKWKIMEGDVLEIPEL